jgi:hypothetical protein
MKDHEIAAAINRVRDIAQEFAGTQQLRERLARELVPIFKGLPSPEPYSGATFDLALERAAKACDEIEAAAMTNAGNEAAAIASVTVTGMQVGAKACGMAIRALKNVKHYTEDPPPKG